MADKFVNISFTLENLDSYYIRTSIFNSLKSSLKHFKGNLLDVGCGEKPYQNFILQNSSVEKYVGLDIEDGLQYDSEIKPDFLWDGVTMPFNNNSFDTAIATEVLEHCSEPKIILKETWRVMKNGGCFFFTVPFLWPLHEVPHDEYRYTPFALERMLTECGFKNIEIKATGGWHASMAQMLGLWVRRAPMTQNKKKILSRLLKPVIKKLIKIDRYSDRDFKESQMITGLSGIAVK